MRQFLAKNSFLIKFHYKILLLARTKCYKKFLINTKPFSAIPNLKKKI